MTVPAKPKHDKLSDTQLILLSQASQRDDRLIMLPAHLRGGAARSVLSQLHVRQLIEERSASDEDPRADRPVYVISEAGLRLLGFDEAPGNDAPCTTLDAIRRTDAEAGSGSEAQPIAAVKTATGAIDGASDQQSNARGEIGAGPEAVGAQASAPRIGSKLAMLIGLLMRPEGASLAELEAATGWLPHTTRGALTGFRKRGYAVRREQAEDGSSRYRIEPVDPSERLEGSPAASDGPHSPVSSSPSTSSPPAGSEDAAGHPYSPGA